MEFENLKDELLSKLDTSLKYAQSLDKTAEFEVYLAYRNESKVNINQGVVQASDGILSGSAIRVITGAAGNKKVSFTSSSGLELNRIKKNIKNAFSLSKNLSVKDPRFISLCYPETGSSKEGIICKDILSVTTSELVPKCTSMIDEAKSVDSRIKVVEAEMNAISGGFAIGNSNGVQRVSRTTISSRYVEATAIEGEDRKIGYVWDKTRERVIEVEGAGKKAGKEAILQFGGKKINETTILPTIWDNIASACYISAGLGYTIRGTYVVEGMSPLADKIGEQIANSNLTIVDDGIKPTGLFTNTCDAEGVPQKRNSIIEKGILKSFLFNSYYGQIFGADSTGNCSREEGIFASGIPYEVTPSIAPTNLDVLPSSGKKNEEDLIALIDKRGILIRGMPIGIFHSSPATGKFSAVANTAFLIEKGEIKHPLKSTAVAGNFYAGYKDLKEVGSNKELTFLNLDTPSLLFDGFSVVA